MRMATVKILLAIILLTIGFADVSLSQSLEAKPASGYRDQTIQPKDGQTEKVEFSKDYWKAYLSDTKSILSSPSRWERSDWIKASLIVGITSGLYIYDQDIQDWAQKNRSDTSDDIANLVEPFGDGRYTLPPLGMLYLYGHFSEDEKSRRVVLLSLESFLLTGVFTQAMKYTGHRHRPRSGDPHDTWDGPVFSTSPLSFPSGHASAAFSIATVIASEYGETVFVPPLAYSIATLTALSRVNDNAHWASDVFVGSAFGYFTAKAIVGFHSGKKDKNLTILPIVDSTHTALLISYRF